MNENSWPKVSSLYFFCGNSPFVPPNCNFVCLKGGGANQTLVRAMSDRLCLEKGWGRREGTPRSETVLHVRFPYNTSAEKKNIFYFRKVSFLGGNPLVVTCKLHFEPRTPFVCSPFSILFMFAQFFLFWRRRGETTSREQNFPKRKKT